jgi:hypothetical protein
MCDRTGSAKLHFAQDERERVLIDIHGSILVDSAGVDALSRN